MFRILGLGILVSTTFAGEIRAQEITLTKLCGEKFSSSENITKCLQAAQGKPCQPEALQICNEKFSKIENIVACVSTIAGRVYTSEEIALCSSRFSKIENVTNCLSNTGTVPQRDRKGRDTDADRQLLRVLREIIDGRTDEARKEFRDLEKLLER